MPGRVFCENQVADGIPKSPKKRTLNHRLGVGERGSEIVSILCPSGSPRKSQHELRLSIPFRSREAFKHSFWYSEKLHFLELVDVLEGILAIFFFTLFLLSSFKSSSFSNVKQIVVKHSRRFSLFLSLSNWVFLFTAVT